MQYLANLKQRAKLPITFHAGDIKFTILCETEEICRALLKSRYGPLAINSQESKGDEEFFGYLLEDTSGESLISVVGEDVGYVKHASLIGVDFGRHEPIAHHVRQSLYRRYLVMHASAIGVGESGVVFSGDTSSGKTTVILDFIKNGFQYLSDDITLMHDSMPIVFPLPMAAHFRRNLHIESSREWLKEELQSRETFDLFGEYRCFVDLRALCSTSSTMKQHYPLRLLIYLDGFSDSLEAKKLTTQEAYNRSLTLFRNLQWRPKDCIAMMVRLSREIVSLSVKLGPPLVETHRMLHDLINGYCY